MNLSILFFCKNPGFCILLTPVWSIENCNRMKAGGKQTGLLPVFRMRHIQFNIFISNQYHMEFVIETD